MEQYKMSEQINEMMEDYSKIRVSKVLTIKKFNKLNQLCYYDRIDLTMKDVDENATKIIVELFENAGYKAEIKENTYQGIYDPSRFGELIEIYPTDLEILEKENRFANYDMTSNFPKLKRGLFSNIFN